MRKPLSNLFFVERLLLLVTGSKHLTSKFFRLMYSSYTSICNSFKNNCRAFTLAVIFCFACTITFAQLGIYQFTGLGQCPNQNPNVTTQPANAIFSPYTNVNATCNVATDIFINKDWNTTASINLNQYNQFSISAASGFVLNLTSISFSHLANAATTTTWYIRSSLDNFTTDLGTGSISAAIQTPVISLSSASFSNVPTVTFRMYLVQADGLNTKWQNDNVAVYGNVSLPITTPPAPISNSPQCSPPGVTLTMTGTPPAGETWFWQTSATGVSTAVSSPSYTVNSSGTYHVRSRNNTSLQWSQASSVAVTVLPNVGLPVFSAGITSSRCESAGSVTYSATAANASSITYSLDAASTGAGNTINASTGAVNYQAAWSGTSVITASAAGCNGPATSAHTVTTRGVVGAVVFSMGTSSVRCQSTGTTNYTANSSNSLAITYAIDGASSSAGNTINVNTGAINFTAGWNGTTTITATATGCGGPKSGNHTITVNPTLSTPVFSMGSTSSRCQSAQTIVYSATATNSTSISYSLDAGSLSAGNAINSATGSITFVASWSGTSTISASATGCNGPATSTHTVTVTASVGTPVFNAGNPTQRCEGAGTATYTATALNSTSIVYELNAASLAGGNTINASTGTVSYFATWVGNVTITATAYGCNSSSVQTYNVAVYGTTPAITTPVFSTGNATSICQGSSAIFYNAGSDFANSIFYSLDGGSISGGNSINMFSGELAYASTWSGNTTVTAQANGCGGPKYANFVVTVIPSLANPIFAMGATSNRCRGAATITYTAFAANNTGMSYALDAASTAAGNTINTSTGAVTYVTSWAGISVITVTVTGCNGSKSATHTVNTNDFVATPVFTGGSSYTRCQSAGTATYSATAANSTGLTYFMDATSSGAGNTINSATGQVNFVAGWSGTTIVTVSAAGCSGPRTASCTITTTPTVGAIVFAAGNTSNRCQAAGSVTYTATASNATGVTYALDAPGTSAGNTIDAITGTVIYTGGWSGTSIITATATGCNGPTVATHSITTNQPVSTPVFNYGSVASHCQGLAFNTYEATATSTTGIIYSLDAASISGGNSINATTGTVNFASTWTDNTIVTASAGGCYGPKTADITITIIPTVGTPIFTSGATSTRCQGAGTAIYTASATNTSDLTYALNAASITGGCTINSNTGDVTYPAGWSGTTIITASAAGCSGPMTATHTVTVTATVGTSVFSPGAASTRCQAAGTVTYTATAANNTGIMYALDGTSTAAGNTINASTGAVTYTAAWNGTSVITATAAGCNGPSSATHTVTITPAVGTPVFASGTANTRCQGAGSVTYTASATNTTGITYFLDAASVTGGNSINSTTGSVTYVAGWSGTSSIIASAAGCSGPLTASHTVTTTSVGTPVFTLGATSNKCQGAEVVTYTATATSATGITYSLDGTSTLAGNTINSSTGAVTYNALWTGTSTITANAAGCNGPRSSTHTVTVSAFVGAPIFLMGATSTRCQGTGTVTYTATASSSTGISYSLDAASISGGNTINAATGAVTYSATWSGNSVITASAAGCSGPTIASHTVTITPTVGTPVFSLGATSTRCQGAVTVSYNASATNTTAVTYTLDGPSTTAGNSINASTGVVTFIAGWSGSSMITASAAGCNGPKTATHSVTTNLTVGTPVFTSGASSTRCQGAGTVNYTSTATNNTGITYNLDASSSTAGNSINAATGAVTFVAGWSGTTTITATASGCNGPASSSHTVTSNQTVTTPVFSLGATSERCQGAGSVTYTATASSTTGITYSLDGASITAGNTINATTGDVTYAGTWVGTSNITASADGCSGPKTTTHTVTTTATVGIPVFASGAISARCQGAGSVTYSATATTSTGISYSLDAASLTGGNTINSITGQVTYVASWFGTTIITASATGCNGPGTSTHTVTVNGPVGTPVFDFGATSYRCIGAANIFYRATATFASGISYSLDAASIAAGLTINSANSRMSYTATYSGTIFITATASGCLGPTSSIHTARTLGTMGAVSFSSGATSLRCQGAGAVTYTANATNAGTISYALDGASLTGGNTINSATGTVQFAAGWNGSTTITATATNCSGGTATANHVVSLTSNVGVPVFTSGATSTRCQGAGTTTYSATATNTTGITYALDGASIAGGNAINAATGAVTFVAGWTNTSIVTASAAGCNGPASSNHTITTTPYVTIPVFSAGATSTRCQGAGTNTYTASATNATAITYLLDAASVTGGNSINTSTGVVTFTAGWSGTTTITASAAGCSGPRTASHVVTVTPTAGTPVFAQGASSTRCSGASTLSYSATATNSTGITFSLDAASLAAGNSINNATGNVSYNAGWTGNTVITASASGCNGPVTANHTVTVVGPVTTPVFAAGSATTRCQGAGIITYNASATNTTGITYSLDAASIAGSNVINATTGAVTFATGWSGTSVVTASAAGCSGPLTASHTITITPTVGTPVFSAGATSTRCQAAGSVTYSASATTSTGIIYSLDAASVSAGNSINTSTGVVTYIASWNGTTIIIASAAGCNGPRTSTHTVTTTPTVSSPVFAAGNTSTRCQGGNTITYTATAANSTSIAYALDGASTSAGITINTSTGAVSYPAGFVGTTFITATAQGCNGPASTIHTATSTNTVADPIFAAGINSNRCQGAGTVTYTATAAYSLGITYALDGASLSAGNTINSATGAVTFVNAWSGNSTITATAAGCNGPSASSHTVTTIATVGTPVFAAGTTSNRCQAAGTITYSAFATNSTSITYSLDAASIAAGNTIGAASGAVTFIAGWNGTSIITASAAGCNGPATATHTVNSTGPVAPPVFDMGLSSTRCQGAATITYNATATNSSGIIYSLDNASLTGGNTINAATGAINYSAGWTGNSVITARANGCFGPQSSTHTVTIRPSVTTPVFALGTSSTRCQGLTSETYNAIATNATGLTYSLDAASLAAGITINSASGMVYFVASYIGSSVITATATGCNGPTSATHTVASNTTVVTPSFASGASSVRCQASGTITYTATSSNASSITYSLDATSLSGGNAINTSTGAVTFAGSYSGTLVITASAAGCNGPKTASHTVTITPIVGVPVFASGTTSTRCQGAGAVFYSATSTNSTGITYILDVTSLTAGNIIEASTGTVNFISQWSGNSTITATATGCSGPVSSTHVVTTTASVGLVAFTFGPTSNRCQSAGVVNYTAAATGSTGITYRLDANSLAYGNTINAATGAVTYTPTWIGSSTITATATGCNGPSIGSHTATTNGLLGNASFSLGTSSARCRGANTVTYVASAPNTIGITYALDAASLAAGNNINPQTGALTFVITWSGNSTITATAAGCNGPKVATHTVTTTTNTCAITMIANTVVENIPAGSKIVNMGILPQTVANGLKPYGLVYELLKNSIPVKWVYNQSKVKDGIDLVHNGINYRGSAFIILADYLSPAVNAILANWTAQGVSINTAVSPFNVEVIHTLKTEPQWVLDASQTIIGRKAFDAAGIPDAAWSGRNPADLNNCNDIFILPHADASWQQHKNLYYWNKLYKGNLWIACYAASGMENLYGPDIDNPAVTIKMNFLMKDGPALGKVAVPFTKHQNATPPFNLDYPGFPVMQFMGKTDGAHMNGPESIFLPEKGGGWRSTTNIASYDPSQKNIPGASDGPAVALAFGRAFGDDTRGWVMYTSGHHIDGVDPEEIATQRSLFNFSFFSIREKKPSITINGIPATMYGSQTYPLSMVAVSEDINPTFTYQWSSSCGGTFSNPTSPTTNFTAPAVGSPTKCLITCKITDNCGRKSFDTKSFEIVPGARPPLCASDIVTYPGCEGDFVTIFPLANDSDPDGGSLVVTLLGTGINGNFVNNGNGSVTYYPGLAYNGFDEVPYQVTNSSGLTCNSTIRVNVNLIDANGCAPDQYYTIVDNITASRATHVGNNIATNKDASLGEADGIVGNNGTYTTFGNRNNVINYTLSSIIPITDTLWFYVDGSNGSQFTVTQSGDSVVWTNPFTYTLNSTENFLTTTAKAYRIIAGARWVKVTIPTATVQLDAMEYFVRSCISANPKANNDEAKTFEDIPVVIDVNANDYDPQNLPLSVSAITRQPLTGMVSINTDNTITYLNFRDQINGGIDSFSYRTCNSKGLCAVSTVIVSIVPDNCGPNQYKPGTYNTFSTLLNPTADTYISSAIPAANYGTSTSLLVKGKTGDLRRVLLKFNLSSIPGDAVIDSASLGLYQTAGPTNEAIAVYRVTKPYTEAGVNWTRYDATNLWTSPGGDLDPGVIASTFLSGALPSYKRWNVRSVVQGWVSSTYSNNGIVLTRNPEGSGKQDMIFNSNQAASNRPQLYIAYRVALACTDIPAYAPLAMPDTVATNSITPLEIKVTNNDFDYNNTGVTVALFNTTTAKGGTLSTVGNVITYTPPATSPAYNGIDTFKYRITSGNLSDSACVFIFVRNSAPQALVDSFTMLSNTVTTPASLTNLNVRVNDYDPESGALTLPTITKNGKNGVATVSGTGTISYTPNYNFIGRDTVYYQLAETIGAGCFMLKDTTFVIFKVNNRPPVSVADAITINPCESVVIPVIPNDRDPEEGNLTVQIVTQPSIGSVQLINSNSEFFYNQPNGISGLSTSFTYRACDNANPSLCGNTVTVTINIRALPPSNNPPVAVRDTFNTNLAQLLFADVLTNDYDVDKHDFVVPLTIVTNPKNGTVLPLENGLIQYVPNPAYFGIDSFQYRVFDTLYFNTGCISVTPASATAWAIIIVQDAPIANWDRITTSKGVATPINILTNDIFGAYGPKTGSISIIKMPTMGTLSIVTNGSPSQLNNAVIYTAGATFTGKDSLIYQICDAKGTCDTAIVYIFVGKDTDNDGVGDETDIDDDNDGITDFVEICGPTATGWSCTPGATDPSADNNGDGIINYKDPAYGPLNAAGCVASLDSDNDGIPDYLDLDSDNDGISDVVEALGVDTNGDGLIDNFCDTDGDGLSQNADANNTGAAGSGFGLGAPDFDNDGFANAKDLDSDNDGIPDIIEVFGTDTNNDGRVDSFTDNDGDGWANQYDGDANGTGTMQNFAGVLVVTSTDPAYVSCAAPGTGRPGCYPARGNSDMQGYPNFIDLDSDGDGITDATESGITATSFNRGMVSGCTLLNGWCSNVRALSVLNLRNTDNHGKPDVYDIDSDNDGITDNIEAQPTSSYVVPTDADTDMDGLSNVYDFYSGVGGSGLTPYDHDADGVPDYRDTDTDNDNAPDRNEGDVRNSIITQSLINSELDTDGDGLMDCFDVFNILNQVCGSVFRNISMSNMGANGTYSGPAPGGSNVQLVQSSTSATDRDWRNNTTLPINIISFNGTLNNKIANLVWKVENEFIVDKYIVERSMDGVNFSAEGIRLSNNSAAATYTFADDLSNYIHNKVYYRIQQVNKNAQYFHTKTILFNLGNVVLTPVVYPNPVIDVLSVGVPSLSRQQATISLSDASGKIVIVKRVELEKGDNKFMIEGVERLSKGLYMVHIRTAELTANIKVVKQ